MFEHHSTKWKAVLQNRLTPKYNRSVIQSNDGDHAYVILQSVGVAQGTEKDFPHLHNKTVEEAGSPDETAAVIIGK